MNNQKSTEPSLSTTPIGVSQIALGIITIIIASLATRLTVFVIALILLLWGSLDIYNTAGPKHSGTRAGLIIGILSAALGILLLVRPQIGASFLALLLAGLFIIGGFQKIIEPLVHKNMETRWNALMGIISLLLGVVILALWPVKSYSFLGIMVGIEILINGLTISLINKTWQRYRQDIGRPGMQH